MTPVFIQRFFKIQNYCFGSPTVLYRCQSKSNNFLMNRSNLEKKFQCYLENLLKSKAVQLVTLIVEVE